jgi:uncharacterized iron-regulated protein
MAATAALAFALLATAACAVDNTELDPDADRSDCVAAGMWLEPATATPVAADRLVAEMARRPVVLLGESHTNAEHHRWQLHTLAALHGRRPGMVLGFESFPRRVQPVLDQWVNGELDAEAFLEAVEWTKVWGYDAGFYLPLFHFARQNRVPMIALNVDRALVSRVGHEGWAAIPADERAGLSDPAPAGDAYRDSLARTFLYKQTLQAGGDPEADIEEADIAAVIETVEFARFVEAQLTWDRAMAEALAEARQRQPGALVVGIMGRGHIEHRHGVPHQLADLEIPDAAVLLPVDSAAACDALPVDLADAVFLIEPSDRVAAAPPRARLGILIETTDDGVRVKDVMEGSVAVAAAIEAGDIVVSAAGFPVAQAGELIEIVQRQAPGTWLPLTIRRDGEEIELVARFPTVFEAPE